MTAAELRWHVARLHMEQWRQQRRLARALHGPVQALLAVAADRLAADPNASLGQLRRELERELTAHPADRTAVWSNGLARLRSTWRGICAVAVADEDLVAAGLDADPLCAEIALEIVSEAVSNAVRHGKARQVEVEVELLPEQVRIVVLDDGQGMSGEAAGLGTRLLEDCALSWSRQTEQGSVLRVTLPMG